MRIKQTGLIPLFRIFSSQYSSKALFKVFVLFLVSAIEIFSQSLASAQSGPAVTFYGLAQYRLRVRSTVERPATGSDSSQLYYGNQIGYYAGFKAKVNDQVSFQAQIGNDWVNTDQVTYLTSNHVGKKNSLFPYFHLIYAKWDPGILNISAGIVPENGYGALDLLERSLALGNYGTSQGFGAGQVGWITGTNNSIAGLKVGIPLLKSDIKLSAEVSASIVDDSASQRKQIWFTNAKNDPQQQLYILDIPLQYKGLSITPQFATVLFRKYNYATQKGDNEFDVGLAGTLKFNDVISVRANLGYATFSNENSHVDNKTADSVEFNRVGALAGIGTTIKAGPGNVLLDVSYSSDEDTKTIADSKNSFYYGDIKYVWSANKNFEITPRLRLFVQNFPDKAAIKTKTETRPELIFTGKF